MIPQMQIPLIPKICGELNVVASSNSVEVLPALSVAEVVATPTPPVVALAHQYLLELLHTFKRFE